MITKLNTTTKLPYRFIATSRTCAWVVSPLVFAYTRGGRPAGTNDVVGDLRARAFVTAVAVNSTPSEAVLSRRAITLDPLEGEVSIRWQSGLTR